jgi:hypothetical protein
VAIQNLRAYYLRFEDYAAGSGNTREVMLGNVAQDVALGRPVIQTQSFNLPMTAPGGTQPYLGLFPLGSTTAVNGQTQPYYGEYLVMNRNKSNWITLQYDLHQAGGNVLNAYWPIAPLSQAFLPPNVLGVRTILPGNLYDGTAPAAVSGQNQTVDVLLVQ